MIVVMGVVVFVVLFYFYSFLGCGYFYTYLFLITFHRSRTVLNVLQALPSFIPIATLRDILTLQNREQKIKILSSIPDINP